MLDRIVNRAKVLLNVIPKHKLSNLEWIEAACGKSKSPLTKLNLYGLTKRINGLAFNRINILLFGKNITGLQFSLNMGTNLQNPLGLDST